MTSPPLPRVLVVDDEDIIRRTVARELRGAFEVVEADGLAQTVEQLGRHEDLVALVSDLDLGHGESGIQVLEEARRRRPGAARILISGRAHPDDVAEHVRAGLVGHFVPKPWSGGTLRAILEEGLRAGCTMNQLPMAVPESAANTATPNERAGAGDDDAACALFQRYRPMLLAIMVKEHRVPTADVDDLLQQVYYVALRYLPRCRQPSVILAKVANHACVDYFRRRQREQRALKQYAILDAPAHRSLGRIEDAFLGRLDIARAMARITPHCATLLCGVFLGQRTQKEYATEAGMPLGTVAVGVARCLLKLRALLAPGFPNRRPAS